MSSDDLKPIREGIAYCRERLEEVQQQLLQFANANVEVIHRPTLGHPGPGRSGVMRARLKESVPVRFARDLGTIGNELRTQLDHLANILGRRNGANGDESSFPLLGDASKLNAEARRKVRQLSEADRDIIWSLQPYESEAGTEILSFLHAMDIFRKHRAPLAIRVTPSTTFRGGGYIGSMAPANDVRPLLEAGNNTDISIYSNVTVQIGAGFFLEVLEPAEYRGYFAIQALWEASTAIESIVNRFEPA